MSHTGGGKLPLEGAAKLDFLCRCGSDRPYQDCHLGREHQRPLTIQEFKSKMPGSYSKAYCLHPAASRATCSPKIIKAHTIQRGGSLSKIARRGQVYGFRPDYSVFGTGAGTFSRPRLLGISHASTFTGFCDTHDRTTFLPIETRPFIGTQEQSFLLGYRAICSEEFAKDVSLAQSIPLLRETDRGKPFEAQRAIQAFVDQIEREVRAGREDIRLYKALYDDALCRGDFSASRYYIVWFANAPDLMCSGATQFQVDFAGRQLQDWTNLQGPHLEFGTFSLIATESGGAAVFQWIGDSTPITAFVRSLHALTNEQVPDALVRLAFEYFENVYMTPDWWEGLEGTVRDRLIARHHTAIDHDSTCLQEDGIHCVSWTVTGRETNAL